MSAVTSAPPPAVLTCGYCARRYVAAPIPVCPGCGAPGRTTPTRATAPLSLDRAAMTAHMDALHDEYADLRRVTGTFIGAVVGLSVAFVIMTLLDLLLR